MRRSFWQSCSVFWRFKSLLVLVVLGAVVSAASFGAGLGLFLPVIKLLANPEVSLGDQLRAVLRSDAEAPEVDAPGTPAPPPPASGAPASQTPGPAAAPDTGPEPSLSIARLRDAANRHAARLIEGLVAKLPADPFFQFVSVLAILVGLTIVGSVGRYAQSAGSQSLTIYAEQWWRQRLFRRAIRVPLDQLHADAGIVSATGRPLPREHRRASRGEQHGARRDSRRRRAAESALKADELSGGTSDLIARLTSDVSQMCTGYPVLLSRTLEAVLHGIAALLVALWLNWQLTALGLLAAPVLGVLIARFGARIRKATRSELSHRGSMLLTLTQAFQALATVKVHNAEGVERRRFHHVQRKILAERLRVRRIKALSGPLMDTLSLIAVCVVASVAAWWVFRGNVEPTDLVVVLAALALAGAKLKPLTSLNNDLQAAGAGADRVMALHHRLPAEPTDPASRKGLPAAPACVRGIRFEHLVHRYRGADRNAVDGVTLDVPAGTRLAIVGGNGSGKTTLLNHLPRLLTPTSGRVLIDGVDLAGVDLRSLRARIAVVSQKTALFAGTIHENIAYGRLASTRDEVVAAARSAFADEFIVTLPRGYDTVLGEGGTGLSGGQSQRISIARAVLRDAPILILDEATSQVDADSEARIKIAVDRLTRGRTTLLIAHRLSTVVDADRIVVMDDGRILATGTHATLMAQSDSYRSLVEAQLIPAAVG